MHATRPAHLILLNPC